MDVMVVGWRDGDNPIPFPAQIESCNDEGITIYNKQDKSSSSFFPFSYVRRADSGFNGKYYSRDRFLLILTATPYVIDPSAEFYYIAAGIWINDATMATATVSQSNAAAVLPYDDSVNPSEVPFEFTFVQCDEPSSGAPSASSVSSLGRYTVMAASPDIH